MNSDKPKGIIIFGASGCGTTTIGKKLSQKLCYRHFDLDDYYWRWDTDIPFTVSRGREERFKNLMTDLQPFPSFVMSGSLGTWGEVFIHFFELAVFVTAPASLRVKRLHEREFSRFGARVLEGGDMYDVHLKFLDWAGNYETFEPPHRCLKMHEEWASELPCPVLHIDGVKNISTNVDLISNTINAIVLGRYSNG